MVKALILLITCCTMSAADHTVALTILAEARGEGLRGMAAVACVIAQRAKERCITPKEVCLQRKQFSCWDSGKDLSYLLDTPQAKHALYFEKHIDNHTGQMSRRRLFRLATTYSTNYEETENNSDHQRL
jgi:hypothetical protein